MDKDAKAGLSSSRQRKISVVQIERPEDLIWDGKRMCERQPEGHCQVIRPLTEYDSDLREKYLSRKQTNSLQDCLSKLHLDYRENTNHVSNARHILQHRNLSLPNWWAIERNSNGRMHHLAYHKGQISWSHPLEQDYRQLVNHEIYRKRSNPLPAPSNYRYNFEVEKHELDSSTLTASELLETSSTLRRLDNIRYHQLDKFGMEKKSSSVSEIEVKLGKSNQPQLPELISSKKSAHADVPHSIKQYFDESNSKDLDWNSCSIEELSDWENMLYRLFLHRTENIFKKFEKYKLILYSEILRRQTLGRK